MRRTLVASLFPVAAITFAWIVVEDPRRAGDALLVAALALAPALLPRWTLRVPALALAGVGALWLAFRIEAWEALPFRDERVSEPLYEAVYLGVGDFYGVVLPFHPDRQPEMHGVVLVAIFGFVAVVGLLVATRRPFLAAAVTIAGVGWPATLMVSGEATIGAVGLAAALWIFVIGRARTATALAVGALLSAAVVAGATWLSSATSFAREAALQWESWDFRGAPARALGVRFVWNARYDGIQFPPTKTTVLEIEGPLERQYWRVSTLDGFRADRWFEDLALRGIDAADGATPTDPLAPAAAGDRDNWLEQRVRVKALVDDHVAAAGTPVALDAPSLGTVLYLAGGVIRARREIAAGTRYKVWSYVPDPTPAELTRAPARYPASVRPFFAVSGVQLPPFALGQRHARVAARLRGAESAAARQEPSSPWEYISSYAPLVEAARRVTQNASSPYEAVLAIESWLRRTGGFRYEEQPIQRYEQPPLVEFVTQTRAGYCQHFAGAMALMLRFLGIPSRVAVGFTSGTLEGRTWKVTDHNAHAWVEVWFPGHGWVPFDPTPGRGTFSGIYSYASENAQAVDALRRGLRAEQAPFGGERPRGSGGTSGRVDFGDDEAPSLFGLVLLVASLWLFATWGIKAGVARLRHVTRDPRRSASASRKELEAYLRDQGVEIPRSATLAWLQKAAYDELGIDARSFAAAAARGRFGPPADARRGAEAARRELRVVLRAARRELSPWQRLRGLVSLRSLRGGALP